jgi:hypothetical protein
MIGFQLSIEFRRFYILDSKAMAPQRSQKSDLEMLLLVISSMTSTNGKMNSSGLPWEKRVMQKTSLESRLRWIQTHDVPDSDKTSRRRLSSAISS